MIEAYKEKNKQIEIIAKKYSTEDSFNYRKFPINGARLQKRLTKQSLLTTIPKPAKADKIGPAVQLKINDIREIVGNLIFITVVNDMTGPLF